MRVCQAVRRDEGREMLGETVKARENGLCLPLPRAPRAAPGGVLRCARSLCHDAGEEETVSDAITLTTAIPAHSL
jgi:hypothetical protein